MAGGKIEHLSRWKGGFIEYCFKPAIVSAALFGAVWMRWASPPRSYPITEIPEASRKACLTIWGKNSHVIRWKMYLFSYIIAAFCEADNAYNVWFFEFCREVGKYAPERKNKNANLEREKAESG